MARRKRIKRSSEHVEQEREDAWETIQGDLDESVGDAQSLGIASERIASDLLCRAAELLLQSKGHKGIAPIVASVQALVSGT